MKTSNYGRRDTIAARRNKSLAGQLRWHGRTGVGEEMLELYLSGEPARDIADAYGVGILTVHRTIKSQALLRLLELRAISDNDTFERVMEKSK